MRSHEDTPTHSAVRLNGRERRTLTAVIGVLLVAAILTGGSSSPLLAMVAGALILQTRHAARTAEMFLPLLAGFLLSLFESILGDGSLPGIVGGLLLAAAALPGWMWRREAFRAAERLSQLDDILAQARRGRTAEAPAAATELQDLERALAAVGDRIGAAMVLLWDVETYRGLARVRAASRGRPGQTARLPGDPLGWVWDQGMRLRVDPTPRWAEQGSVVIADRLRHDDEQGLLVTYAFHANRLPVDDTAFEESAVYLRGLLAVQEARATAAAGKRRTEALLDGLRRVPGELDLESLSAGLCETAIRVADATGAVIASWDGEIGQVLAVAGADGGPRPGDTFAPPASELALAVRAGTMLIRDAASWSFDRTNVAGSAERWIHRPRSLAALPLRNAAGVNGVLAVWSARSATLDPDGLELLPLLAPQIALHIEQAREFHRIRETAARDPLTQLRNRRAFDEIFASETVRFARYGRPLSLLIIDLDHFKSINDQFGHEAGDEVLCRAARMIESSIRDIDTPARFGGEEFVVLLPETDIASALDVAERIRASVAAAEIDFRGRRIPVRASIGVSACPDRVALPGDLVSSADAALYQAKADGRNRVIAATR